MRRKNTTLKLVEKVTAQPVEIGNKPLDRSPHNPKVSPFVDDPIPPTKAAFFRRIMGFHLRTSTIT